MTTFYILEKILYKIKAKNEEEAYEELNLVWDDCPATPIFVLSLNANWGVAI